LVCGLARLPHCPPPGEQQTSPRCGMPSQQCHTILPGNRPNAEPGSRSSNDGSRPNPAGVPGRNKVVRRWSAVARVVLIQERQPCLPGFGRCPEPTGRAADVLAVLVVIDLPAIRLEPASHEADPKTETRVCPDERRECWRRMSGGAVQRHGSAELQVRRRLLSTLGHHVVGDLLAVVQAVDPGCL